MAPWITGVIRTRSQRIGLRAAFCAADLDQFRTAVDEDTALYAFIRAGRFRVEFARVGLALTVSTRYLFYMRSYLMLSAVVLVVGCSFDPSFGDLTCETEGATSSGRRCTSGVWIADPDAGALDMSSTASDGSVPDEDATSADSASDAPCSAESDLLFCNRLLKNCEDLSAVDNCGDPRVANCGPCEAPGRCTDNVCEVTQESDQEFCDSFGATCDMLTAVDRTGAMRTADCGSCTAPLQCGVGGTPNTCACANADDAQFCIDNGANCGPVTAMDPVCMVVRTVNCGTCTPPETCGGGGTADVCGCMESDAEFCTRLGRDCGVTTADDACGVARTVACGACALPETCGGGGQMGTCGCTVADACFASSTECGVVDVSGRCVNLATADCGGCGANGVCMNNSCNCTSGYAFDGATCGDIDECASTPCDANAMCTNMPGTFSCACNGGFMGDGFTCTPIGAGPPVVVDTASGESTSDTIVTGTIDGVDDDLYVAFISIRTGSRTVDSVSGLGLMWRVEESNCNASDQQRVAVYTARGNTSGNGVITVQLSNNPFATAVAVYQITNVPSNSFRGASVIHNSNGQNGACNGSNPEADYSFAYTPQYSNSLLLAGTGTAGLSHSAGTGWTEIDEFFVDGFGASDAGLAVMSRANSATSSVTVAGSTILLQNWVTGLYEVRGN